MLSPELARIRSFEVIPSLPEPLRPLLEVAYNLWWTWHPEAVELFLRLDRNLWHQCNHNPVRMLGNCPQHSLDRAARDEDFLSAMQVVLELLRRHITRQPTLSTAGQEAGPHTVAYFSAEFGLTECLQVYSGGLGCLAGDHLKSASELGIPLVGVGLLYRHGYFQQFLNADGWQQEYYPDLDFPNLPIKPVLDRNARQVKVTVQLPGRTLHIAVWAVLVGRITLYLLDTNVPENDPPDRGITGQLYGGDMEMRIKQELVLGIGGVRALAAVGIEPDVCHMNEGHSAFLALERIRRLIEKHNISFDEARQYAAAGNIFTTHTPVPAGIDRFPPEMLQRYFRDYTPALRLDAEGLLALGRENVFNKNEFFSMAVLAIRTADHLNAVSKLHGVVSRSMWQGIWPGVPVPEVPIGHVTNGVHARSWLSPELIRLFDRFLEGRWQTHAADHDVWQGVNQIPDEELWHAHEHRRNRLVDWTRRRLRRQLEARGATPEQLQGTDRALDPSALTIGFARRFATYKRANLLLRDPNRLRAMFGNPQRPIQFIIAGKAHPADGGGKDLIRQIVHYARDAAVGHRVVFIENYDIHVARYLVQGCDVWLNTPRRGLEASGTSGMKAALNGVLNCSILDGWWDEACDNDVGWAIGRRETHSNPDVQDDIESHALYDLLEQQILPLFYERDDAGIPRRWVARMKHCLTNLAPVFNTNRMVRQYTEELYLPALRRARLLGANNLQNAIALAKRKDRLRSAWSRLKILEIQADLSKPLGVRDKLSVTVLADLDNLRPEEVSVQVYAGLLDNDGRIIEGTPATLQHERDLGQGRHRFTGQIAPETSGRHGFAVRIVPGGEVFQGILEPGLILWEKHAATVVPGVAPAARPAPAEHAA